MAWWRGAGRAIGAVLRRWRPGRPVLAGVALLAVVAVTWAVAVAGVTTTSGGAPGVITASGGAAGVAVGSGGGRAVGGTAAPALVPGSDAGSDTAAPALESGPPSEGKRVAPPSPGGPDVPIDVSGAAVDRSVVRTARLDLTVADVAAIAGRVRAMAAGVGGFVAGEQSVDRSASFTLRIPAPRLDEVMGQLSGAGTVTARSEQADDVTDQLADLDGRLETAKASVARVRALLDKATTVGDVVMIESELTQREADLDSLRKRLATVSGRVAMSTLAVRLAPAPGPDAQQPGPGGFLGGLAAGWRAFLVAAGALLAVIGAVLPFAVLLALLGGLGVAGRRLLPRRRTVRPASGPDGS